MLPTVDEVFASKTLKASDFQTPRLLTITAVDLREFTDQKTGKKIAKYVLNFAEEERDFVCNATNSKLIAKYYGIIPEKWIDKQIVLFKHDWPIGGEIKEGIMVRMPKNAPPKKVDMISTRRVPTTAEMESDDNMNDEIPF